MLNEHHASISSVQYLRHDLMIELGRLEMVMEDYDQFATDSDRQITIENLQNKHARVSAALGKLPLDR
ncbi:MAG: hypothetical protein JSS42_13965 [Proteobacteria bacterium]|uniref:hypothetical protein n=1 Tax=Rudaea sp. TaxID=2136325 RepID=UPI0032206441|nr:hypothetical protein [Pseudomonadota bacterium]